MAFASGARASATYVAESTRGTTPGSPTMIELRLNSIDINPQKGLLRSEEIRSDRQVVSMRHGSRSVQGSLVGELALQVYDDWLENAMAGSWTGSVAETNDIAVGNPDQVTRSSGSFITDGFRPGDVVALGDLVASGEEGQYLLTVVTALAVTLRNLDGTTPNLTAEAENSTPTLVLVGNRLDIGTTLASFTVERRFLDIAQYEVFTGVTVNTLSLEVQPESIPLLTFGVLGMNFAAITGTSLDATPTAAPSNEAMSPFDGKVFENGASVATVTGINLELANGRTLEEVIGANASPDLFEGNAELTGQITVLVENATLANKFVNETETSVWLRFPDPADSTAFLSFVMPRVKLNGSEKSIPRSGPVIMTMPFEALRHATTGTMFTIQRSNT